MYREIDDDALLSTLEREERRCPACDLSYRLNAPRCACGYDLRFEGLDPAIRFELALRKRGWAHVAIGAVAAIGGVLYCNWSGGVTALGLPSVGFGVLEVMNGVRILRGRRSWHEQR